MFTVFKCKCLFFAYNLNLGYIFRIWNFFQPRVGGDKLIMKTQIRLLDRARKAPLGGLLEAAWKYESKNPDNMYWKKVKKALSRLELQEKS